MKCNFLLFTLFTTIIIKTQAISAPAMDGRVFEEAQAGKANWIDKAGNVLNDVILDLMQKIFNNVSALLHNKIVYTIFGVAIMLWALNQLKNGYPTRDELWKVAKWIIMTAFILAIFTNYDIFKAFLEYCTIPASWVVSALNGVFTTQNGEQGLSAMAINLFNDLGEICVKSFEKAFEIEKKATSTWWKPDAITEIEVRVLVTFWLIPTWIMTLIFGLIGICFVAVIMFSKFMATLLLCFAPILAPLLALPFTKQYFYSWLKLWITYTLIAPIAMLVLSIATSQITEIAEKAKNGQIEQIIYQQWNTYITPMITGIICLYLLRKIPTWIQQILGVQGAEGSGLGVGAAVTSAVTSAGTTAAIMKVAGKGGFTSNFMKALPAGSTAGAIAGAGTKTLGNIGGQIGGAMQNIGKTISAGDGIMASAGKTLSSMGGYTRDISRSMRRGGQSTLDTMLETNK